MRSVVILGGGFAGVWAAQAAAALREHQAARDEFKIQLVSRDSWLTIRPRLYEASLGDTRVPLAEVVGPAGVELVRGEATAVDLKARAVTAADGAQAHVLPFDRLVIATGSRALRPSIEGAEFAFSVDTYTEAMALETHLASRGVRTDRSTRADRVERHTAVVVGAGFTGIEVATTLIARMRRIAPAGDARVVLVERAPTVAPDLGPQARAHVERALATLGIETRTNAAVAAISPTGIDLTSGGRIAAATTVWTGGFRASELVTQLPAPVDDSGRVAVDRFLGLPGDHGVYVAGDAARAFADVRDGVEQIAPMSCQCAIPMGDVAGHNAAADLLGLPRRKFAHHDYVTCLDLGGAGALFMSGWNREVRLSGYWAGVMKQTINTRLIYPPRVVNPHRGARSAA